jgi:hypothetical protein
MYPCQTCANSGRPGSLLIPLRSGRGVPAVWVPCPDCIGGVASCCDTAGSADLAPSAPDPEESATK